MLTNDQAVSGLLAPCLVGGWQYPGEKEITFPPFTCLESNGDPRLEHTEAGELIIFPLKATSAPQSFPKPVLRDLSHSANVEIMQPAHLWIQYTLPLHHMDILVTTLFNWNTESIAALPANWRAEQSCITSLWFGLRCL
jgi:hypothetical protein